MKTWKFSTNSDENIRHFSVVITTNSSFNVKSFENSTLFSNCNFQILHLPTLDIFALLSSNFVFLINSLTACKLKLQNDEWLLLPILHFVSWSSPLFCFLLFLPLLINYSGSRFTLPPSRGWSEWNKWEIQLWRFVSLTMRRISSHPLCVFFCFLQLWLSVGKCLSDDSEKGRRN